MRSRYFSDRIVEWYLQNYRKLPWRKTKNPYKIWLSEVILQQTRVNQGLPYFKSFVEKYPTVFDLAKAKESEVLRTWQGLGYYTRARNLHKCAKVVVESFEGKFPQSYLGLKALPGIGDYTAAAISSICFREPQAVLDGNVFRVLSRVFGVKESITSPQGKKIFGELAISLIDIKRPDIYNQAIMEFGALHCTPKNPMCSTCIFELECFANKHSLQSILPIKIKSKTPKKVFFYYFIFRKGSQLALRKRKTDIWQGLYEFHLISKEKKTKISNLLDEFPIGRSERNNLNVDHKTYKHVLSHRIIMAQFIVIDLDEGQSIPKGLKFYSKKAIDKLPKPILINKYLIDHKIL